ncbi:ATP synthase subunit mitochondrial [Labeo rohita]|uniref:ATP synthase subunit mitochondrial n=1 Tax=Labeo rohita TaxID=84645 RepID=A0A498LEN6_LABRO|nr:ATP synthase subunit mitochondrial [Labeo rohita]
MRCGAKVRFRGFDRWQHDYNGLPTGPFGRYRIEAIDATESCIMYRGFDHLGEDETLSVCHRNLEWLLLSDLPGVKDKDQTVDRLQTALPRLTIELDLV